MSQTDPMQEVMGADPDPEVREQFDPEHWPRDPDEYYSTRHFRSMCLDSRRCIKPNTAKWCISVGELIPTKNVGEAKFYYQKGGVTYYLVVGGPETKSSGEPDYRKITIWPWVHDETLARKSIIWTNEEIENMKEVNKDVRRH